MVAVLKYINPKKTRRPAPPVRLYQFYNFAASDYGRPFSLCDRHKEKYNPPALAEGTCILRKIADGAVDPCFLCCEEPTP